MTIVWILMLLAGTVSGQGIKFRDLDNLGIPDGSLNMIPSQEGNFLSVGYWEDDSWLMKLNPCGGIIWSKQFHRGAFKTLGFDVVELPNGHLASIHQIDTLIYLAGTPLRIPAAWLLETDACGNVLSERILEIPVGIPISISIPSPAAAYAMDLSDQDELVLTGQMIYWNVTNLSPLDGTTRKTAYLARFSPGLQQQDWVIFDQFPLADTLVAFDVLSLPDKAGYVVSGAYYEAATDSIFHFALRTDSTLATLWIRRWAAAPPEFLPTVGGSQLSSYHAATTLALGPGNRLYAGGSQYLDTTLGGLPIQTIGAAIAELDLATGNVLKQVRFPDLQRPLSLGLRLQPQENGLLLAGSVLAIGATAPASAVFSCDWDLQPTGLFTYTDGGNYHYLATAVLPTPSQPSSAHALSGLRFLPASDTSSSVVFFNSGAVNPVVTSPSYYGGPIVQIEEVNVVDTAFCAPSVASAGCSTLTTRLEPMDKLANLAVFPQPAAGTVQIRRDGPLPAAGFQLLDLSGAMRLRGLLPQGKETTELDLTAMPAGLYVLRVEGFAAKKVLVE